MNHSLRFTRPPKLCVTPTFVCTARLCIMVAITTFTMQNAFCQSSPLYLRMLMVKDSAVAQQVADRLTQGEPFARLAVQYSIHVTKQRGGFLGLVALEELQEEVRTIVEDLQVGAVTGPIRIPAGLVFFQRTSMTYYDEARRFMQSEKYLAALAPLAKDLVLNPDHINSLELKAYALEQLGRTSDAEAVYREIIRQAPENVLAHNNLGALLDQAGTPAEAVRLFERAIAFDPTQHVTLYNLAWLYTVELTDLERALGYIQQAIVWSPDTARYYALQGKIYQQQEKWQQARIAMARAAKLDPQNSTYQDSLAALNSSGAAAQLQRTAVRRQPAPPSNPALSRHSAPTATVKVVAHPDSANASRQVIRLLQQNGFPVARQVTDPKPIDGLRIYYKPHASGTAERICDLIKSNPRRQRLSWNSQFDIIVYVGQSVHLSTDIIH